jgi:hypothetical protein
MYVAENIQNAIHTHGSLLHNFHCSCISRARPTRPKLTSGDSPKFAQTVKQQQQRGKLKPKVSRQTTLPWKHVHVPTEKAREAAAKKEAQVNRRSNKT